MDDERFLDEVVALELRLLDPRTRAAVEEVDRLLHEDFSELGASGRRWDRVSTIAWLAAEPGLRPEVRDMAARSVAEGVVLVTYVATQRGDDGTSSLRSSLWLSCAEGWSCSSIRARP